MDNTFHATGFYDKIADKYNWFFSSRDRIMESESAEIGSILREHAVKTVLDCSCGDGLQSIALARRGYTVTGSDISSGMIERARCYAKEAGVTIRFEQADFRELEKNFPDQYDCVLSWGNAIPHLMTETDIYRALSGIYGRTTAGGIAVIEMRNYDKMLQDRPRFHPMRIHDVRDGFRYSILYVFDYFPDRIRFNVVYLMENLETGEKRMEQEAVDYNPIQKENFTQYLQNAGFCDITVRENDRNICYIAQKGVS